MKKRPSILAVDDDQEMLRLLRRVLELEGYRVVVAADGKTALALQEECKPDLVLLDIIMPRLNGYQVLDLVRQQSNVPVIMLTANGDVTSLRQTLIAGADDYVTKPFRTSELLARIRAKLRRDGIGILQLEKSPTLEKTLQC